MRFRTSAAGLAGGTLILGSLAIAAAPMASASVSGFVNGPVGVPQTIVVPELTPVAMGQQTCTMAPTINNISKQPVTGALVNGTATFVWSPPVPGAATFTVPDCTGLVSPGAVNISQVSTMTTISAPNTAQVGVATKITVTVQSQSPSSYTPTGQVVIRDANGATVTTMGLTAGPGTGQAYAYYYWTPTAAGQYIIQATYNGDANASASPPSAQDIIQATPSGSTISVKHPPVFYVGVPTTLTANVVPPSVQGSVGFTINGQPITGSIPIVNGQASTTWTPTAAGTVTLGASYTTNQGGTGSTSEQITIQPPSQTDSITLVQPGWGPWVANGTYTLGNGSNFAFQASTLSGAPVTLSETGPCQVSGLTITVPVGAGVCNLRASSPGGNNYAPITVGYTINLIPGVQQADVIAPQSGSFKVGRVLLMESPGRADTNAGQNITWNVKKPGKKTCKLLYPNNGSVTLRIVKKGSCTVVGRAPGVPGQWQPLTITRTYTGR
jgi:hypothetical protein